MKGFNLFFVTVIAALLFSCEQETIPLASFDITQVKPTTSPHFTTFESIKFINTSTNSIKNRWDFGNGKISKEFEPVIVYTNPGEYTITMEAESESGNSSIISKKLQITERIVNSIKIHFQWNDGLYSMEEVGWTEDKTRDFILVIGKGNKYSVDGTIDEVIFQSDTLKDITFDNSGITIYPHLKIAIYMNLIDGDESNEAYKLQLYAIDNGLSKLFFTNNGLSYYYDNGIGQFALGSVGNTILLTCDYK